MDGNNQKLKEYQKVLRNIVSAFKNVPFPVVLESALGYEVLPFDKTANSELLEDITALAHDLLLKHYKEAVTRETYRQVYGKKPRQFRVNDVSGVLERELTKARVSLKAIQQLTHLPAGGYPDFIILDKLGRTLYMDVKTTTRPSVGSPRDFFFTGLEQTLKKVICGGFHLLMGFLVKESVPEQFRVVGWKLVDLSKLRVSLKPEFNASNPEIYKAEGILAEELLETL